MSKIERDALEELLRHSAPRPAPDAAETAATRAALKQEWRELHGRRRARRRLQTFAIAATVLLGVFAVLFAWRAPLPAAVPVASIDKSFGTVYLLGENAELRATPGLAVVMSGQAIVTGSDSGLAIAWGNGGSLRIDEDTRVRFSDSERVFLEDGRVYFDSRPGLMAGVDAGDTPVFKLETAQGAIAHAGTQYMAEVDGDRLIVSVREGEVQVDGRFHEQRVEAGQQATLSGSRRPELFAIGRSGGYWDWITRTTPDVDVDGWTLYRFLGWAGRELGVEVQFEGEAEGVARAAILRGTIDIPPANALRLRLATAALDGRLEEGVLYISD